MLPRSCGDKKSRPNIEPAFKERRSGKHFLIDYIWRLLPFLSRPPPLIMLGLSLPCSVPWEAHPQRQHQPDPLANRLYLSNGRHQKAAEGERVAEAFPTPPAPALLGPQHCASDQGHSSPVTTAPAGRPHLPSTTCHSHHRIPA